MEMSRLKAARGLCDELLAPSGIAIHPVVARDDGLVSRFVDWCWCRNDWQPKSWDSQGQQGCSARRILPRAQGGPGPWSHRRPQRHSASVPTVKPGRFPKSKGQEGLEYLAELLPKICRVFIDADNAEKLSAHQNNAQPRMRTVSWSNCSPF